MHVRTVFLLSLFPMWAASIGAEEIPFDTKQWTVTAVEHRYEDFAGRPALFLSDGFAQLEDRTLEDGVIEFDVAFGETRGFSGVIFRMQDRRNFENFYLRPHQSGNIDATQYQPVFNGIASWQLYHGPSYSAPVEHRFGEWMSVKIIVAGDKAAFYVDSEEPIFVVHELKRGVSAGPIAVNASSFAPAWFSRFQLSDVPDDYQFAPPPEPQQTREFVPSWRVSMPFSKESESVGDQLQAAWYDSLTWQELTADRNGVANIAELHGISDGKDTVLACTTLSATDGHRQRLEFGFSDEVTVYANGTAIYAGTDIYRSRDYRYLGSIGLFDSVYLPATNGGNTMCFAVSENFGGWGLVAARSKRLP